MKHPRVASYLLVLVVGGLASMACSGDDSEMASAGSSVAAAASLAESGGPAPLVLPPVEPGTAPPNPYSAAQIERGRYLVEFGGCHDCHTPWVFSPELGMPAPDMARALSGHPKGAPQPAGTLGAGDIVLINSTFTAFRQPFGTVYSMNLTPDIDTGTGSWTEKMFVDAIRTGRHLGGSGRPVLPPMPFPNVSRLNDGDLVSVFAYLRSLPPVRNQVPSPEVPEEVMWALRDGYDKMLGLQPAGERTAALR